MRWPTRSSLTTLCIAALVVTVVGCAQESPEEQVARLRTQYTVELNGFTVEEPEPAEGDAAKAGAQEAAAVASEASAAAVAGEAAMEEGEEAMEEDEEEMPPGPRPADVILHLLVRFGGDGGEALPGVTVEVTQADPSGKEKQRTRQWIDAAGMQPDETRQVDLKLEGVEYEDGDAFSVLLREGVPPEERGAYREFAETGS